MSAIPVIEPTIEQMPTVRPPARRPAPVIIELPRTRAPRQQVARIKSRKRTSSLVASAASFALIAGVTYGSMSLVGQVMVEKARRDSIRSTRNARAAANEVAQLRIDIQTLVSPGGVQAWALDKGFVSVDTLPVAKVVTQNGPITR